MLSIVIILSKYMKNYNSFSTFGNIWTKLRNRLRGEKAEKLAKIQRFLKKNVEEGESEEWYYFLKFKLFLCFSGDTENTLVTVTGLVRGGGGESEIYCIICGYNLNSFKMKKNYSNFIAFYI